MDQELNQEMEDQCTTNPTPFISKDLNYFVFRFYIFLNIYQGWSHLWSSVTKNCSGGQSIICGPNNSLVIGIHWKKNRGSDGIGNKNPWSAGSLQSGRGQSRGYTSSRTVAIGFHLEDEQGTHDRSQDQQRPWESVNSKCSPNPKAMVQPRMASTIKYTISGLFYY